VICFTDQPTTYDANSSCAQLLANAFGRPAAAAVVESDVMEDNQEEDDQGEGEAVESGDEDADPTQAPALQQQHFDGTTPHLMADRSYAPAAGHSPSPVASPRPLPRAPSSLAAPVLLPVALTDSASVTKALDGVIDTYVPALDRTSARCSEARQAALLHLGGQLMLSPTLTLDQVRTAFDQAMSSTSPPATSPEAPAVSPVPATVAGDAAAPGLGGAATPGPSAASATSTNGGGSSTAASLPAEPRPNRTNNKRKAAALVITAPDTAEEEEPATASAPVARKARAKTSKQKKPRVGDHEKTGED
jgi:hypothetical protein